MARVNISCLASTIILAVCFSIPAQATTITDLPNDFIPSFTGTHSGDIDALSVAATFDGSAFHLGATMNANIGTLGSSLYVFGFNRGASTSNFSALGLPNIVFDTVITMTGAGVTGGRDLFTNTALTLPAGAAHISGNTFQLDVPLTLLPSLGLSPLQYGINLWPRDASQVGNAQISDFAPDSTNFNASAVPEPASFLLLGIGISSLALYWRFIRVKL